MVHFRCGWFRKLSLREVNDLWGADDGFDIFPLGFFSFPEPALEVLYLFLRASKKPEQVRNQGRMTRAKDFILTRSRVTSSR